MQKRGKYDPKPKENPFEVYDREVLHVTIGDDKKKDEEPKKNKSKKKKIEINSEADFDSVVSFASFDISDGNGFLKGSKVPIDTILNREILVTDYRIGKSKFPDKDTNKRGEFIRIQFLYRGEQSGQEKVAFSGSKVLITMMREIEAEGTVPFRTKIIKESNYYKFT